MTIETFWKSTPKEIDLYVSAEDKRRKYEAKLLMSMAWHSGQFAAIGVNAPKKMPSLKKVLDAIDPPPKVTSSVEHMMEVAKAITKAFGGTINE